VCERFGIDMRTAALQFAAAPKIVSAIIPGARVPGQVRANAESMSVNVPQEFWEALRREKLILSSAESPA
jgi:D-threo-aldose 1-dehydrogenase